MKEIIIPEAVCLLHVVSTNLNSANECGCRGIMIEGGKNIRQ